MIDSHMKLGNELATRATQLDAEDELAGYRDQFHLPVDGKGEPEIYFVGNSLGLQPKRTRQFVLDELDAWQKLAVRAHFEGQHPWMPYHEFLTEPMAEIVGGHSDEVVMMNGLTVNLHLMLASFYRPDATRRKILIEEHAFPSDHYAVESQIRLHGLDPGLELVVLSPETGVELLSTQKILQAIDYYRDSLSVILLPGVQYYTGQVFEMEAITAAAHEHGIAVGFDLAHAAGNIELKLHDWNVDFAVWCSYKYLNSGPGSVAGCFIHRRHAVDIDRFRLAGWWGHDKESRFRMPNQFQAITTAEGWQLSNPPILSMAAVRASLEVFKEAGMGRLVAKSKQLTGFFEECVDAVLADNVEIVTPRESDRRGCQLSLKICAQGVSGREVFEALESSGVQTDWREPDVIRAAPVPLYNTFNDVSQFVARLKSVLDRDND